MNETKIKTVFEERDDGINDKGDPWQAWSTASHEIDRLKSQLTATEESLARVQREKDRLSDQTRHIEEALAGQHRQHERLGAELDKVNAQLTATEQALKEAQRESAALRDENAKMHDRIDADSERLAILRIALAFECQNRQPSEETRRMYQALVESGEGMEAQIAQSEAARKVAKAAVQWCNTGETGEAEAQIYDAFIHSVREYHAITEPPATMSDSDKRKKIQDALKACLGPGPHPFSPAFFERPGVKRGIEKVEGNAEIGQDGARKGLGER